MKQLKCIRASFIFIMTIIVYQHQINAQVNLNSGLIAHLPLNGSGEDISGNNNNAFIVEPYVFGGVDRFQNFPGSMRFVGDASSAKMSFNQPLLNNRTEYTVSFWFWLSSQNGNGMNIFGQDNLLEVGHYVSPNRLSFYHPTSGTVNYNLNTPHYNNWRHVVITGNSTEMNVYINGDLVITNTGNFSIGSNSFNTNIGGHVVSQFTTNWLRGGFDDLRIYDRVITNDEIEALYANNTPEISISSISSNNFCAGDNISLSFSATGEILQDNEYQLQMSDPTGDFSSPVVIGKINSSNLSETFNTTIPSGTPSGTNYLFRVTSSIMGAVSDSSTVCTINGVLGDIPNPSQYQFIGEVNGKMYYKSSGSSGWGTAQNTSIANGGHLATIPDSITNALLFYNARNERYYFGFHNVGDGFKWVNNDPVTFDNWPPGQPASNNSAEMRNYDGAWIAVPNTTTRRHFMELNPQGLNTSFCTNDDIILEAFGLPGATYNWTGPNGFTSTDQNPVISNATSVNEGNYILTYTLNGCTSEPFVKEVTMNALPGNSTISVLTNSICQNSSAVIIVENTDSDLTYQLQDAVTSSNIGSPQTGNGDTLFFNTGALVSDTDFNFSVDFNSTGCNTVTNNVTVTVLSPPNPPTTTGDEICNGGEMTLEASGAIGDEHYNWYTSSSGGTPITGIMGNTLNIDTNVTANYYVSITDENGCESSLTQVTGEVINPLNPPVDLYTGLILHYKFDGNLADSSGYGYNATVSGTNSYVNDRFANPNSAINSHSNSTGGGSNFISVGNPAKVQQLSEEVTISMWIRQTQTWFGQDGIEGQMPLVNKWNGSTGLWVGLRMINPSNMSNRVRWRVNNGTFIESNTNVPVGVWHHVVCTYDHANLRIYQNGVLTGTSAYNGGNIANTAVNLMLGRQANGTPFGGITYRGDWDEVKIYNRALNLSEVKTLYNNESVAFVNAPFCDEEDDLALTTFEFPGATYSWTGPNGFTSTEQNPTVIANADSATYAGTYTLVVTDANGCVSPPQIAEAIIYPIPLAPITVNDTICGSGNAVLEAETSLSNPSFNWYTVPVGGTPINGQNSSTLTINNVSSNQIRYVSVVKNGCEGPRVPVEAIYYNEADLSLTVTGGIICEGDLATIIVENAENGIDYEVFLSGTSVSNIATGDGTNLIIPLNSLALSNGSNILTIEAISQGCGTAQLLNTAEVIVHALPTVSITSNNGSEICTGDEVTLTASSAVNYLWSNGETTQDLLVNQGGIYSVTIEDLNGCSVTSASFEVIENAVPNPTISSLGTTVFCDGESVTIEASGGATYIWSNGSVGDAIVVMESGDYYVTAFNGNCSGISNEIAVNVLSNSVGTETVTACESYLWIDGVTYTLSNNNATHVLSNAVGCDSIVTLNLTITNNSFHTDVVAACDSYTWIDGVTYTENNSTATHILTNAAGCDSIVSLALTIGADNSGVDVATACESYTWIDGITYTSSNNSATHTLTNVAGCDSIVQLNLTITNAANTGTDYISACDNYTWIDGVTYTSSNNSATYVLTNVAGCDSTITLDLTLNTSSYETDVITACGEYTWIDGLTYNSSNNSAVYVLTNATGCDSVVTLNLTIPVVDVSIASNLTVLTANQENASYQWLDCNNGMTPIPNENGQSFNAQSNGSYAVEITYDNCTDTSACELVSQVGTEDFTKHKVSIYPNPTNGEFKVLFGMSASNVLYTIYSAEGRVIQQGKLVSGDELNLDLSKESMGIYFLKLNENNETATYKIVKNK